MEDNKKQIIELYFKNVHGKKPDTSNSNPNHDGKKGHWLERQFGISANGKNDADLMGYELKNETKSKTTFGDWSANEYIYTNPMYNEIFNKRKRVENRDIFLHMFGDANNPKHPGRYSWSGSPVPKIGKYNDYGQILIVDTNNDIVAMYSYSHDKRSDKMSIVHKDLQLENLELARWYSHDLPIINKRSPKSIKQKFEDKFSQNGWFTCKKDTDGKYCKICFGEPMNFYDWLDQIKQGIVIFDGGMYIGNSRPYSEWRANNKYWDGLIVEEYTELPE